MGPDLWNEQEYKLTLEQMGKMKMNKLTIHTYAMGWTEPTAPGSTRVGPVCSDVGSPEPHLWLGLNGQFDSETGAVHDTAGGGAYPSAYASSLGWYGKEVSPSVDAALSSVIAHGVIATCGAGTAEKSRGWGEGKVPASA